MASGRKAEFDAYAPGYDAGMGNGVKALLGSSADSYVAVKLRWLLRRFPWLARDPQRQVLDYGCGTATLLRLMAGAGVPAALSGTDVSAAMLEEGRKAWPAGLAGRAPRLQQQAEEATGLPGAAFDLVIVSAVLHHVPPPRRDAVYREVARLLRPGGTAVVFEHNPRNPLTRYVVARTPIDRDAILLPPGEAREGLARAGLGSIATRYLMFLPPRLSLGDVLDRTIGWLPLGGQYAVEASRGGRR